MIFSTEQFEVSYELVTEQSYGGIFSGILEAQLTTSSPYDGEPLYPYPEAEVEVEWPEFDFLLFPTEDRLDYPLYLEL